MITIMVGLILSGNVDAVHLCICFQRDRDRASNKDQNFSS